METVIRCSSLVRRFGRKVVLDNVSLDVPRGVVFALLGENGAGKTTLIRTLMGFQRPDGGLVRVLGLDPAREAIEVRRRVGFVSDAHEQYEWMKVSECGWFASAFHHDGYQDRFGRLARDFELPPRSRVRELSKGMRAKLSLALALAADPELLVLDEPTSGLDPLVRRSFLEGMIERAAGGKTVFLSSHQIHEVERVADWVAILAGNQVRVAAPLDELKKDLVRIEISQRDPLLALPAAVAQLQLISASRSGRTWTLLGRGAAAPVVEKCQQDSNVIEVLAHRPNLEELYVATLRGDGPDVPVSGLPPAVIGVGTGGD